MSGGRESAGEGGGAGGLQNRRNVRSNRWCERTFLSAEQEKTRKTRTRRLMVGQPREGGAEGKKGNRRAEDGRNENARVGLDADLGTEKESVSTQKARENKDTKEKERRQGVTEGQDENRRADNRYLFFLLPDEGDL